MAIREFDSKTATQMERIEYVLSKGMSLEDVNRILQGRLYQYSSFVESLGHTREEIDALPKWPLHKDGKSLRPELSGERTPEEGATPAQIASMAGDDPTDTSKHLTKTKADEQSQFFEEGAKGAPTANVLRDMEVEESAKGAPTEDLGLGAKGAPAEDLGLGAKGAPAENVTPAVAPFDDGPPRTQGQMPIFENQFNPGEAVSPTANPNNLEQIFTAPNQQTFPQPTQAPRGPDFSQGQQPDTSPLTVLKFLLDPSLQRLKEGPPAQTPGPVDPLAGNQEGNIIRQILSQPVPQGTPGVDPAADAIRQQLNAPIPDMGVPAGPADAIRQQLGAPIPFGEAFSELLNAPAAAAPAPNIPSIGTQGPVFGGTGSRNPLAALAGLADRTGTAIGDFVDSTSSTTLRPGVEIPQAGVGSPQAGAVGGIGADGTPDLLAKPAPDAVDSLTSILGSDQPIPIFGEQGPAPTVGGVGVDGTPDLLAKPEAVEGDLKTEELEIQKIQEGGSVEEGSRWGDIFSNPDVAMALMGVGTALLSGKDMGEAMRDGIAFFGASKTGQQTAEDRKAQAERTKITNMQSDKQAGADLAETEANAARLNAEAVKMSQSAGGMTMNQKATWVNKSIENTNNQNMMRGDDDQRDGELEAYRMINAFDPDNPLVKPMTANDVQRLNDVAVNPSMNEAQKMTAFQEAAIIFGVDAVNQIISGG